MRKNIIDFTMGADPEFGIFSRTNDINIEIDDDCSEFGLDGNGTTYELRPTPSKNPLEIVSNIHTIFTNKINEEENEGILNYHWVAGSFYNGYTFGGHIHFGIKENIIRSHEASKILDDYLGLSCILLENRRQGLSRRRNGYGLKSDYRNNSHGFEYRVCSSWLTSPYVAAGLLCLGKTVMYEVLNNKKFVPSVNKTVENDFKKMQINRVRPLFNDMWNEVKQMKLYNKFAPQLNIVETLINNNMSWFPKVKLKEAWGLVSSSNNKPTLTLNDIWNLNLNY